jgi:predicted DCC family thiol-disulfide oxidoreductase YuxK
MSQTNRRPLEVFYDGSCGLCENAMRQYRRYADDGLLVFTDISNADFSPERFLRTRAEFMDKMHARDASGRFFVGVDAIAAIWRTIPNRPLLTVAASVITAPGINRAARVVYFYISKNRRRFARRCEIKRRNCNE